MAIAEAWDTCGVATVVLPGQRDVLFAQPLRAPAEGTVASRNLSHEELTSSVDEAVGGDAERRAGTELQILAPRQHAGIVGAENDT